MTTGCKGTAATARGRDGYTVGDVDTGPMTTRFVYADVSPPTTTHSDTGPETTSVARAR